MDNVTIISLSFHSRALFITINNFTFSFTITCPAGWFLTNDIKHATFIQVLYSCQLCPNGKYRIRGSSWNINYNSMKRLQINTESECKHCPYGGVCINRKSVSRGKIFSMGTELHVHV